MLVLQGTVVQMPENVECLSHFLFWISNELLRIKLSNEYVFIVSHDCDLERLFPGNPLIFEFSIVVAVSQ